MQSANKIHVGDRARDRKLIGNYLIEANLITEDNLLQALEQQKVSQARIGDILVKQGSIEQKTLDYFVAKVVKPEQSKNLPQNGAYSSFKEVRSGNSIEASDLANKTLNLNAISLSPVEVFTLLSIVVISFVLISLLIDFNSFYIEKSVLISKIARLFKLDKEHNIPTLYSGLALGFCSILLLLISNIKNK